MKIKKEYIILAAVILGLLLYLFLRKSDRTLYHLPELAKVSGKEISKIEIVKGDIQIVLKKIDSTWTISPQDYPADESKVKGIIDIIENLTLTVMVSETKNYNRYDLSSDKKITVKAWTGDKLRREIEIGKDVASSQHTFVKLTGDDRVYHARNKFRDRFDRTREALRDMTVLSFTANDIEQIKLTKGEQTLVFNRTQVPSEVNEAQAKDAQRKMPLKAEMTWQSDEGKRGDESVLQRLLSTLSNLKCEKYINQQTKNDFNDPIYTLELKGSQDYRLSIFAKINEDDKNYPAISSENDYPFLLPEWQADNLMPSHEVLFQKTKQS
jgi:hypothetical protein